MTTIIPVSIVLLLLVAAACGAAVVAYLNQFFATVGFYSTGAVLGLFMLVMMKVRSFQLKKSSLVYSDYRPASWPIGLTRIGMLSLLAYAGIAVYPLLVSLGVIHGATPSSNSGVEAKPSPMSAQIILPMLTSDILSVVLAATQVALPPLCFALIFALPLPELPEDRRPNYNTSTNAASTLPTTGTYDGGANNTEFVMVKERQSVIGQDGIIGAYDGQVPMPVPVSGPPAGHMGMRTRMPYNQTPSEIGPIAVQPSMYSQHGGGMPSMYGPPSTGHPSMYGQNQGGMPAMYNTPPAVNNNVGVPNMAYGPPNGMPMASIYGRPGGAVPNMSAVPGASGYYGGVPPQQQPGAFYVPNTQMVPRMPPVSMRKGQSPSSLR